MDNRNDRELVERYLTRRDEASFRDLYRRHAAALYGMAVRLSRSEMDAQDALQDAWMRACGQLDAFEWRSSLRTWLIGILINCIREQSRKCGRYMEEPLDELLNGMPVVGDEETGLRDAIARLPDGYRHVLMLHDIEGYTHEEIAGLLEINPGTSKSQLHHARRAVRIHYFAEQEK